MYNHSFPVHRVRLHSVAEGELRVGSSKKQWQTAGHYDMVKCLCESGHYHRLRLHRRSNTNQETDELGRPTARRVLRKLALSSLLYDP